MGVDWYLIIPGMKEYYYLGKRGEWGNTWSFMYLAVRSCDGFLVVRDDTEGWMKEIKKKGWTKLTDEGILAETDDEWLLYAMQHLCQSNSSLMWAWHQKKEFANRKEMESKKENK